MRKKVTACILICSNLFCVRVLSHGYHINPHFAYRAEEEIIFVMDKFILQGIVDLLEYYPDDDVFEIVDYKTGPKLDHIKNPQSSSHFRKQMEIYAFLIEKRFGKTVRRMKFYYTSVNEGVPYIIFEFRHGLNICENP